MFAFFCWKCLILVRFCLKCLKLCNISTFFWWTDKLQESCNYDACVAAHGDKALIMPNVEMLFNDEVNMVCVIDNIGAIFSENNTVAVTAVPTPSPTNGAKQCYSHADCAEFERCEEAIRFGSVRYCSGSDGDTAHPTEATTPSPTTTTRSATACNHNGDCGEYEECQYGSCVVTEATTDSPTTSSPTTASPTLSPSAVDGTRCYSDGECPKNEECDKGYCSKTDSGSRRRSDSGSSSSEDEGCCIAVSQYSMSMRWRAKCKSAEDSTDCIRFAKICHDLCRWWCYLKFFKVHLVSHLSHLRAWHHFWTFIEWYL